LCFVRFILHFAALVGLAMLLIAEEPLETFSGCTLVDTTWADGDSFPVKLKNGRQITFRLYGADCIEWHVKDETLARRLRAQRRYFGIGGGETSQSMAKAQSFGKKAAERTRELLVKPFSAHTAFTDARGGGNSHRVYAFITTADGKDLASVLVAEGLARAFGIVRRLPDGSAADEYREKLRDMELVAAGEKKGIWASTDWERLSADRAAERAETAELASFLKPQLPPEGVNPNTAPIEELESLPGIGNVLAQRMIEERHVAPFEAPQDLKRVKGVSAKLIESLAPSLRFKSKPTTPP